MPHRTASGCRIYVIHNQANHLRTLPRHQCLIQSITCSWPQLYDLSIIGNLRLDDDCDSWDLALLFLPILPDRDVLRDRLPS